MDSRLCINVVGGGESGSFTLWNFIICNSFEFAGGIFGCMDNKKDFLKIPKGFLIIRAPVFGDGIVFPIMTDCILLFSIGILWLADLLIKANVYIE